MPLAWMPFFSAPDPTVKRKTGFLVPTLQHQLRLRLRCRHTVLLCARPRLRCHLHADDHDQAGAVAARRVAPAIARWLIQHPGDGHFPARQGACSSTPGCRHPDTGIGAAVWSASGNSILATMGLGMGRHAAVRQDVSAGLRPPEEPAGNQPAQDSRPTTHSRSCISQDAASAATSTRGRCIFMVSPPPTFNPNCRSCDLSSITTRC